MPFLVPLTIAGATALTGAAAAGATAYGAYASGKSARNAQNLQARANAEGLAADRAAEATRKTEFDRTQEELRRQWDAEEAFRQKSYAAQEDDRLSARSLLDAKEARRAPYRQASQAALLRMGDLLRSGSATPGAAQFMRSAPLTMNALVKRS